MKRMRGRNHRGGSGGGGGGGGPVRHQSGNVPMNRNHIFDSSGPDLRIRGTSQQLFEKYLQLGRDATSSGDRVMAESYFQYAEHYFRILNAMNQAVQQNTQQGGQPQQPQQPYQGNQQGSAHYQRRPDHSADQSDNDQGRYDDDQQNDQSAQDSRPITITAGAPES